MDHSHHDSETSHSGQEANTSFCTTSHMGGGMTMYMDGFRSTLFHNHAAPCINLFFPGWTINTRGKLFLAIVGVFLLGIAIETVAVTRTRYLTKVKLGEGGRRENSLKVQLILTLFHGLQVHISQLLHHNFASLNPHYFLFIFLICNMARTTNHSILVVGMYRVRQSVC